MDFWSSIPSHIDPVLFSAGAFSFRWYAACFLLGFGIVLVASLRRSEEAGSPCDRACVFDLMTAMFAGVLLGGRLGFALFYEPGLFLHPISLVSPFESETGAFVGIRGMSFFGSFLGAAIALRVFSGKRKIRALVLADFLVPAVPLALFFGRMGNFLNGELYGRPTGVPWGMYFPYTPDEGTILRHPSQLYEVLLEGIVLFVLLNRLRRKRPPMGFLTGAFLSGYAVIRFLIEFFRAPDIGAPIFFGWMTVGQMLSLLLLSIVGGIVFRRGIPLRT